MPPSKSESPHLRFTETDLTRYAALTGDQTPLSTDPNYAAKTPYGERVVFGVLAALRAIAQILPRSAPPIATLKVRFQRPLHLNRDYHLQTKPTPTGIDARLQGASGTLYTRIQITFRDGAAEQLAPSADSALASNSAPANNSAASADTTSASQLAPAQAATSYQDGTLKDVRFALSSEQLEGLSDLCGAALSNIPEVTPLVWGSQFVGMTAPGESAYLASFELVSRGALSPGSIQFDEVRVETDERFRMVTIAATAPNIELSLQAADRPPPIQLTWEQAPIAEVPANDKATRALITGASRGFGLALTLTASRAGLPSYGAVRKKTTPLESLEEKAHQSSCSLSFLEADLSTPQGAESLHLLPEINLLILSASPPIQEIPLLDQPPGYAAAFVQKSLDLTINPLETMLPRMSPTGTIVLISSIFVESAPKDLTHYVDAKKTLESHISELAANHPTLHFLIVRPGKMLTDQTNGLNPQGTPLPSPFDFARQVIELASQSTAHLQTVTLEAPLS